MSALKLAAATEMARRMRVVRDSPLIAPPNNFNASQIKPGQTGQTFPDPESYYRSCIAVSGN
jgi:hypothetical protein